MRGVVGCDLMCMRVKMLCDGGKEVGGCKVKGEG